VTSFYVENNNLTGKRAGFVSFCFHAACVFECSFVGGSAGTGTFGCGLLEEALLLATPAPIH